MTSSSWPATRDSRLRDWVEQTLEGRFKLTINREKTRVVKLTEPGASLSFLGFTFRYDRDLQGRNHRYLNVFPSKKSVARLREKLRAVAGRQPGDTHSDADRAGQSDVARLETLLLVWLPADGVPRGELGMWFCR